MARNEYAELLRDPRWQRKRLEILDRDEWKCRKCGNKDETLHVHHSYYAKGMFPWEYPSDTLRTLCKPCHKVADEFRVAFANSVAHLDEGDDLFALGLVQGIVAKGHVRRGMPSQVRIVDQKQAIGMAQSFGCPLELIEAAIKASPYDEVSFNPETGLPEAGY